MMVFSPEAVVTAEKLKRIVNYVGTMLLWTS